VTASAHSDLHPSTVVYFLWQSSSFLDTSCLNFLAVEFMKESLQQCQLLKSACLSIHFCMGACWCLFQALALAASSFPLTVTSLLLHQYFSLFCMYKQSCGNEV